MPNSPSAKKRLRQDAVKRARNRAAKSVLRKRVRTVMEAIDAGDVAKAETAFRAAAKVLDQAGAHRVIHPNAAARKKSRLQGHILKVKQASA